MDCIIEHPTRGILMDQDWDGEKWVHKFSWSKPRNEAQMFPSLSLAYKALTKMDKPLRTGCAVLQYGTWEVIG